MLDLIVGIVAGILVTLLIGSICFVSCNSYKVREKTFHNYFMMDELWLKTTTNKLNEFMYKGYLTKVSVKCNSLECTNHDVRVYSAYINDIKCATSVKSYDGASYYYTFHVDSDFDESEVIDILECCYNYLRNIENEETEQEEIKKSVLRR